MDNQVYDGEKNMGSTWIELHLDLRGHPKVVRLHNVLCVSMAEATGILINLWLYAAAYAKDGNLTKFTDKEIESACMYERDPQNANGANLVESLIECDWIDVKNGKKIIHDWKKYGLKLLKSNNERVRKHRKKKELEEESENYGNVTVTSTLPNLTIPNPTLPDLYGYALSTWNEFAAKNGLSTIMKLTDKRKAGVRVRVRDKAFDLGKIFTEISSSNFLLGTNNRNWKCDFDFVFCSANNYLKILEGKYRNGKTSASGRGNLTIIKSGSGGATTIDDARRTFEETVFSESGT